MVDAKQRCYSALVRQGFTFGDFSMSIELQTNALVVDLWCKNKGVELYENDKRLSPDEWADCFAAFFEPNPTLTGTGIHREFFEDLMVLSEWKSQHKRTNGNVTFAWYAAIGLADNFAAWIESQMSTSVDGSAPAGDYSGPDPTVFVVRAAQEASSNVEMAVNATQGLLPNKGQGTAGENLSLDEIARVTEMVQDDELLAAIMEWAGKFRRVASAAQTRKTNEGPGERSGFKFGRHLNRLVQSEVARFGVEEAELLQLKKLATNRAMEREYESVEKVGKGGIVVVVDESSSMNHAGRNEQAKALAAALALVAKSQDRWIGLVGFSGGKEANILSFAPGEWDVDQFAGWLTHFYGGGTTTDVPVHELPTTIWDQFMGSGLARGKTDVIMVTDGHLDAGPEEVDSWNAWKAAEKVTSYGLVIGYQSGDFNLLCDRLWHVADLNAGQSCIEEMFGEI